MDGVIFQVLSAGGDLATMALFLVAWKLDRRLVVLETMMEGK